LENSKNIRNLFFTKSPTELAIRRKDLNYSLKRKGYFLNRFLKENEKRSLLIPELPTLGSTPERY